MIINKDHVYRLTPNPRYGVSRTWSHFKCEKCGTEAWLDVNDKLVPFEWHVDNLSCDEQMVRRIMES